MLCESVAERMRESGFLCRAVGRGGLEFVHIHTKTGPDCLGGAGLKYTHKTQTSMLKPKVTALSTRTPIKLTTITGIRLTGRIAIGRRAAKMDAIRTVYRLNRIMEF
jgi:hypothetical protein